MDEEKPDDLYKAALQRQLQEANGRGVKLDKANWPFSSTPRLKPPDGKPYEDELHERLYETLYSSIVDLKPLNERDIYSLALGLKRVAERYYSFYGPPPMDESAKSDGATR